MEQGKFLLLGLEPERVLANPLFIASHVATAAYVSYWSALHYYGFTEQVPLTTLVATTRKRPALEFHGLRFQFVTIKTAKFFGYRRELVGNLPVLIADEAKALVDAREIILLPRGNGVLIADEAKALVDSLDQPRYAGGVGEVAHALRRALDTVELSTLVEYANRMANRALGSRLGFLLTTLGRPAAPRYKPSGSRSATTWPTWVSSPRSGSLGAARWATAST